MRTLFRIVATGIGTGLLCATMFVGWFYFSSSGLPDVRELRSCAPQSSGDAPSNCFGAKQVSSAQDVKPILPALYALEGRPDASLVADIGISSGAIHRGRYAIAIARSIMPPSQGSHLAFALKEIRTAIQIRRRFYAEERSTIYLNTGYFGEGQRGVSSASQRYFGVSPDRLTTAQSALLAGLLLRPADYSPYQHPDRALARRNQVLEIMKSQGALSEADASAAERLPLGVR